MRLFQFAVDTKVVAPEGAGSYNDDTDRGHGYFFAAGGMGASTASRQRA